MNDELKQTRFIELDLLRGLAVTGMIVFHVFFVLNFYGVYENDMSIGWWQVLGQFVRFTFLGLVGIGMVISYQRVLRRGGSRYLARRQQWQRALVILVCALLITVATYIYIPENYVRFGILHLIAASIFLWSFFLEWKWLVLILALLNFLFEGMPIRLYGEALDYFPLFPWTGIVGVGIFLGHMFYSPKGSLMDIKFMEKFRKFMEKFRSVELLIFLGKKALLIYMIHVPLIVFILWMVGMIDL